MSDTLDVLEEARTARGMADMLFHALMAGHQGEALKEPLGTVATWMEVRPELPTPAESLEALQKLLVEYLRRDTTDAVGMALVEKLERPPTLLSESEAAARRKAALARRAAADLHMRFGAPGAEAVAFILDGTLTGTVPPSRVPTAERAARTPRERGARRRLLRELAALGPSELVLSHEGTPEEGEPR